MLWLPKVEESEGNWRVRRSYPHPSGLHSMRPTAHCNDHSGLADLVIIFGWFSLHQRPMRSTIPMIQSLGHHSHFSKGSPTRRPTRPTSHETNNLLIFHYACFVVFIRALSSLGIFFVFSNVSKPEYYTCFSRPVSNFARSCGLSFY